MRVIEEEPTLEAKSEHLIRSVVRQVPTDPADATVAQMIGGLIESGLVRPGERLPPERELSQRMGLSRPIISLALRRLEGEGLIRTERGRSGGTIVLPPKAVSDEERIADLMARHNELVQILDLRIVVEGLAARLAAENRSELDVTALEATLSPTKEAYRTLIELTRSQLDELEARQAKELAVLMYRRYDNLFHLSIAQASGDLRLAQWIWELRASFFAPIDLMQWHWKGQDSPAEHSVIAAAIREHDASHADQAMRAHIRKTKESFESLVRSLQRVDTTAKAFSQVQGLGLGESRSIARQLASDPDIAEAAEEWARTGKFPEKPTIEGRTPASLSSEFIPTEVFTMLRELRLRPELVERWFRYDRIPPVRSRRATTGQ